MKISELIHQLHQMQVLHGDIEVGHEVGDGGCNSGFEYIDSVSPSYPNNSLQSENKDLPAWCIELR